MAKKKQRTELDIDDDIPEDEPAESAPPPPPPEPEPTAEPVDLPKRKLTRKQIIIIAAVAVALIVVTVVLVMMSQEPEKSKDTPAPVVQEEIVAAPEPLVKEEKPVVPIGPYYQFDPFLTPLKDGTGQKYIRITFSVKMTSEDVAVEIDRNLVLVRENIFAYLMTLSEKDFKNDNLRREVLVNVAIAVNRSIQSGAATQALITEMTIH